MAEGGAVSNTNGYLGRSSGSTGVAIITGAGSRWTNSGSLYVGYDRYGTLTVAEGGQVTVAGTLTIDNDGDVTASST